MTAGRKRVSKSPGELAAEQKRRQHYNHLQARRPAARMTLSITVAADDSWYIEQAWWREAGERVRTLRLYSGESWSRQGATLEGALVKAAREVYSRRGER